MNEKKERFNDICRQAYIKINIIRNKAFEGCKGQGAVEYIVSASVLVLLVFGMYKVLQSGHALEDVVNWFKKTFTAGAKNYKS